MIITTDRPRSRLVFSAHVRGMQRALDTGPSTRIGWLAAQMVGSVQDDPIFRGAAAAHVKRQSEP
jgi:hypothetical protein